MLNGMTAADAHGGSSASACGPINFRMRFPALDGLRALAVTAVFLDHYGGGAHGGRILNMLNTIRIHGWAGVDLFFVLSGFLITGVLYDTVGDAHYFKRFYARRSLRIFPVYYLVFAVLLLLTPITLFQWRPGHALFLIYMGNLIANHDFALYDVISARSKWMTVPIGHLWSLCVEEQFYLLWPLLVIRIRNRRSLLWTAAALSSAAFAMRVLVVVYASPITAERWIMRTLPFRMDDLLMGGILALLLRGPAAARVQTGCKWLFLAAAAGTVAVFYYSSDYDSALLLTAGLSCIGLASTGLIGMALRPGGLTFRTLTLRPLLALGRYSYGFYVYHLLLMWQWIRLLTFLSDRTHSRALSGAIALSLNFATTFLIAKFSFNFFESRFLRYKKHFEYDSEKRTHQHAFLTPQ